MSALVERDRVDDPASACAGGHYPERGRAIGFGGFYDFEYTDTGLAYLDSRPQFVKSDYLPVEEGLLLSSQDYNGAKSREMLEEKSPILRPCHCA